MELELLVDRYKVSTSDGNPANQKLSKIIDVLAAKNVSLYVMIHDIDADTALKASFDHGPNDVDFMASATALFGDATTEQSEGLSASSSAVDVTTMANVLITFTITPLNASSGNQTTISVWMVKKPF